MDALDVSSMASAEVRAAEATPPVISMVIPCYNDCDNLDSCLAEVTKALDAFGKTWEIIFIDDFSKDGSLARLLSFAKWFCCAFAAPRNRARLFSKKRRSSTPASSIPPPKASPSIRKATSCA